MNKTPIAMMPSPMMFCQKSHAVPCAIPCCVKYKEPVILQSKNKQNYKHWDSAYQGTSYHCCDTDPDSLILVVLRITDRYQNLIICSLSLCQRSLKI